MTHQQRIERLALVALVIGACGIGLAPIFVRLSPVGPVATAFWRLALACPFLLIWLALPHAGAPWPEAASRPHPLWMLAPGLFFAADLAVWHWSIHLTSVANATLLTNCAPVIVTLVAWRYYGERFTPVFLVGMLVAFVGVLVLMRHSLTLSRQALAGDALGLTTAFFYAGYQLSVKRLRAYYSAAFVAFWGGLCSAAGLWLIAAVMGESFLWGAPWWYGLALLLGLALVSQVAGQGAITYALAHLPSSFSSVALLVQPVVAALAAWAVLSERITVDQLLGGVVVLSGIVLARRGSRGAAIAEPLAAPVPEEAERVTTT